MATKTKRIKVGCVLSSLREDGSKNTCLALGNKGKNPKYNYSVEMIVRDSEGNVVHKQTDGFVELVNPHELPHELLKAGKINEDQCEKMLESAGKLSSKIKLQLQVSAS